MALDRRKGRRSTSIWSPVGGNRYRVPQWDRPTDLHVFERSGLGEPMMDGVPMRVGGLKTDLDVMTMWEFGVDAF